MVLEAPEYHGLLGSVPEYEKPPTVEYVPGAQVPPQVASGQPGALAQYHEPAGHC